MNNESENIEIRIRLVIILQIITNVFFSYLEQQEEYFHQHNESRHHYDSYGIRFQVE